MNGSVMVSVILSFFNEEDVLPELVARLRNVFREGLGAIVGDFELIFVNDASTDRSFEILLDLSKGNRDIRIVNTSRTFGVSPCVLAGMRYASGDAVIYMDADLQDPPEMIVPMVKTWLAEKADVIHMRRASRAGEPRHKMLLTRLGYRVLKAVSSVDIEPEVGDFKLLSRRAVKELTGLRETKPFTRGLVRWIGFRQITMDYNREERFAGKTKFPVTRWKVIANFLDSALISFSDVPLKIPLFLGVAIAMGALAGLIAAVVMLALGRPAAGWAVLAAIVLFLGGLQLLASGIVGLYLHAIYVETKNRPDVIVDSTHGFDADVR